MDLVIVTKSIRFNVHTKSIRVHLSRLKLTKCEANFLFFRGSTMKSRTGSSRVLFFTGRERIEIEDQQNHYLIKESEKYADIIQVML